ncbi:MAG: CBS domain-containing protein [Candidatus Bathyarchaeota archaeon]
MAGILTVKDVMTKDVKKVGRDTNMQAVINMMNEFEISSIVIIQNDKPVGIVTHKDILLEIVKQNFAPIAITAQHVMSAPLTIIDENASLEEAAKLMTEKKIKKLPVVKNEKLVGIITSMDIVREQPNLIGLLEDICSLSAKK